MKKDIYIIKNSINNKVYIGQSKDAAKRWLSHIYDARYEGKVDNYKQEIHKAMYEYGFDKFHYEILEYQIQNYDERERYWIKYYNSVVPNGYNVAPGGGGTGSCIDSANSVFDSQERLMKCISEISATKKSFANIAKKYGCSQEVISAINSGERYRMETLVYPLRNTDTKYPVELVKQIRYSLKYETDLTIKDVAAKYGVDISQVSLINQGKKYFLQNESYPLRNKRKRDLDTETANRIIDDIIHSDLCMSDIAAKYNVSNSRISSINNGVFYKQNDINYPLRQADDPRNKSLKKFLDRSIIAEIQGELKSDASVKSIAEKYGVSGTTIRNINNGACKKYRLNGVVYPIRKIS